MRYRKILLATQKVQKQEKAKMDKFDFKNIIREGHFYKIGDTVWVPVWVGAVRNKDNTHSSRRPEVELVVTMKVFMHRNMGGKVLDSHCLKNWRYEPMLSRWQEGSRIQLECNNKGI